LSYHFDIDLDTARRRRSAKWRRYPADVIPLWVAEMDFPVAPAIRDRLRGLVERGDFGYPPGPPATAEFGEGVAAWMRRRHGWSIEPDFVTITSDTMLVIEMAIERFTEPGDPVVLTDPVYYPFRVVIENAGRVPLWVPMILRDGRWELDTECLETAFARDDARLFLHCHPHNPTGTVFTIDEMRLIADLAERYDMIVVSDEVHADIGYDNPHVPFATVTASIAERTITASAASKAFNFPGLRCGFAIAGNRSLHHEIRSVPPRRRELLSIAGYEATLAAFEGGEPWLEAVNGHLAEMRDHAVERLRTVESSLVTAKPDGTYLLWTDWRSLDLDGSPERFLLDRARVALSAGRPFGPSGGGFLRLNFATSRSILDDAIDRIEAALESG
jgi:cystathionine beta-lyase